MALIDEIAADMEAVEAEIPQTVTWQVTAADSTPRGAQTTGTSSLNGTTRVRLGTGLYDDVLVLSLSAAAL